MQDKAHWESVYASKATDSVSWFQPHADISLEMIRHCNVPPDAAIIDVGGGASTLVDDLLDAGHSDLTVLDLSGTALAAAKARLGTRAAAVHWQEANITAVQLPPQAYDIWHDRAVFHFLTEATDRHAYVRAVLRALKLGGHLIVGTFAEDGPEKCSGLPVRRYSAEQLHAEFGAAFDLIEKKHELHRTPVGTLQHFVYCHCVKTGS